MNAHRRGLRRTAFAVAVVLTLATLPSYGADFVIGAGGGFALDLKEGAKAQLCQTVSIGLMATNHFSVMAELYRQREVQNEYSSDEYANYLGVAVEYRLFEDVRRTWNPYISCGVFTLLYLWELPEDPGRVSFQMGLGTRIRLAKVLYLNPRIAYFSSLSSVSFRADLDLIL